MAVAELCLGDAGEAAAAVQGLGEIDCGNISYGELIGHQLLQKLHFVERHLKEEGETKAVLERTRTALMGVFKAGFTDVSRFVSLYEQ